MRTLQTIKQASRLEQILRKSVVLATSLWLLFLSLSVAASEPIEITGREAGEKSTGTEAIWHDPNKDRSLDEALAAYQQGQFIKLNTAGSTRLKKGAVWTHFALHNTTDKAQRVQLEYVDHQLIELEAYEKSPQRDAFLKIADLSLDNPFSHRPIAYNRFVFEASLLPNETHDFFVKLSSDQSGYAFPSLRIWQPSELKEFQAKETSALSFLFGGFFVMSIFALIAGITSGEKMFYAYSAYSFSKLLIWSTVLGYAHQYIVTEHYSWRYMSISGALTIFSGIFFARMALQSREYMPRLDWVLILMLTNSVFLFVCGIFKLNTLAILSITFALFLYPFLAIASFVRWRQGSTEAAIYAVAWSVLVFGLVVQAMRDVGWVPHNYVNYYWPPVASFTEMLTIMVAMGIRVRRFRVQKEQAEKNYRDQMERSKAELEVLVQERTKELAEAKKLAEFEAHTDALTGTHNRRSFLKQADSLISQAKRKTLSLHLLMLDIDHFKSINDTYGHNAGDNALLAFCHKLSKSVRDNDVFGRVGGEEFALLINEETAGSHELAERIRQEVEEIRLDGEADELRLTVSIGIARFEEHDDIDSLMKKSDTALYQAKENGRNCVVAYASETA
ncbi:diguanylate cyclase [Aurantivibrio plasticivorans]